MSVSILIPAFRPRFLGQAIASALAQGHEDFELIVSDDSGGPDVLPVVEQFRDPRICYVATTGRTGSVENARGLWRLAKYDLIKYLFDDDLLMPHAVGDLVDLLEGAPDAGLAFGRRQIVNEKGRVSWEPPPFKTERVRLDRQSTAESCVGTITNPIGEFSNILINRARGVTDLDFLSYQGIEMRVMSDVGFYLNVARNSACVGQSRLIGSFRKHDEQNSSPAFNPVFALGICEWEVFLRGEYSDGALSKASALAAVAKLGNAYRQWSISLPLISQMASGLAALRERIEDGETAILDDDFRSRWDVLVETVMEEKVRRDTASQPPLA